MQEDTLSIYTVGPWDPVDSYGKIACYLACELTRLGVHVNALSLGETVLPSQSPEVQAITRQPITAALGGLVMGWPTHYAKMSALLHAGPKMALTMFESSILPQNWLEPLNGFDAIITPSQFCVDVFRHSGITKPIHLVPLGISPLYKFSGRSLAFTAERPLTFLAFLDRGERKGGIVALQAFLCAFGEDRNVRLILKGRKVKTRLDLLNANIEVIQEDIREEEMAALYARCDVLINPHRGEGFGLIPREFAATGGLSLTTNWSGTVDDLIYYGVPIAYHLEAAGWKGNIGLEGEEVGDWATVNVDALAALLCQVRAEWPTHQRKARSRAMMVRRLYSWPRFAERIWQIWKEVNRGRLDRQPTHEGGSRIPA
jgi:glycosyltransferase involved in cell wall biosynthesis